MRAGRVFLFSIALAAPLRTEEVPGDRFVWTAIKHGGDWDPYGDQWPLLRARLERNTSLRPWPARRETALSDEGVAESPFLLLTGRGAWDLTEGETSRLREHLSAGGFLLLDNAEGSRAGPFARSAGALPERLFPGAEWRPVPADHALFRSFFLLKGPAGRRRSGQPLQGLWVSGRLAAVYSADDILGAWVPAPAGGWLFPCEPGGEVQREQAHRLLVNIVLFSVTGTYKTDAIHQEILRRKLQ